MTPNIFRPYEMTQNDLIYAACLVEVFKVMIENYQEIFDEALLGKVAVFDE
jgi:hypothetical protein